MPERGKVTWIPAHPSYGSMSMNRYAALLSNAREETDLIDCQLLVPLKRGRASTGVRQLNRRLLYPLKVKMVRNSQIAHILDHSWSDLLPWVPKGMKKVVTVHDLIPLRFPGELNPAQQNRFKQWVSCIEQADAIVSVSEYTKREIVDLLKIPSSKIAVIPNGVEITKKSADRPFINDGGFVIGSIGSILQRKNLGIFVEALKYLKDINKSPITLLRVGPALPDDIVQPLLQILGTSGLVELGRIEDKDLPRFYDSLDCIVIPSLYEGFGLPVLEGLASRIPVVSSNRSSLPEVGKDIPLYFDPASPKDLANVLADLITEGLPQERIQRGFELADLMSWRKTLTGIYSVYETLL